MLVHFLDSTSIACNCLCVVWEWRLIRFVPVHDVGVIQLQEPSGTLLHVTLNSKRVMPNMEDTRLYRTHTGMFSVRLKAS